MKTIVNISNLHWIQISRVFVHQIRPPEIDIRDFENSSALAGWGHTSSIFRGQCHFHSRLKTSQHRDIVTDQPYNTHKQHTHCMVRPYMISHLKSLVLDSLTHVIREWRLHGDVIGINLRCGVKQDGSVYSSVVEEIKISVLNKVASRISVRERCFRNLMHFVFI